jgi:hypothetical protein
MSAGDIDVDGTVGIADFLALLSAWGDCSGSPQSCQKCLSAFLL